MDQNLKVILQAAASVQAAVVKFKGEEGRQSLQAKIALDTDHSLHCVIADEVPKGRKVGEKVHLIQKHKDDYFFIAGRIADQAKDIPGVLSIDITRAFWFVRKRRGSVTWLREKYTYEKDRELLLPAC
jgi:hypothetical protein